MLGPPPTGLKRRVTVRTRPRPHHPRPPAQRVRSSATSSRRPSCQSGGRRPSSRLSSPQAPVHLRGHQKRRSAPMSGCHRPPWRPLGAQLLGTERSELGSIGEHGGTGGDFLHHLVRKTALATDSTAQFLQVVGRIHYQRHRTGIRRVATRDEIVSLSDLPSPVGYVIGVEEGLVVHRRGSVAHDAHRRA